MSTRSVVVMILISLAVCSFTLMLAWADGPAEPRWFPDNVERAMLLDAWQSWPHVFPPTGPTSTGAFRLESRESPTPKGPRQTAKGPGWPFQTNGEIFSRPCFDKSSMYFGACDGVFYCLDKTTGAVRWKKDGLERVDSAPALHEGTVFFAAIDNTLYALNCTSGEVKWTAAFPGIGYQSPVLVNNILYIAAEGQLLAFDPSNGSVLRRYAFSGEGRGFSWNSKSLVVATVTDTESNKYTGNGSVVCFDYNAAKPRWTTALGGASLERTLACDENNCYLGARDGFFYAIRTTDGKIVWRVDCRGFFSGEDSKDKTTKEATGRENYPVWADGHVIDLGTCVVFSAFHQLINGPSVLVSVDKNTAQVLWVVRHPMEIEGQILAAEGTLVAMAEDRQMLVVRIADGKSVSLSPLRNVFEEGQMDSRSRGEFAGVFLDEGDLFVLGADKHVWRLPFASVKGTLEWPVAHLPGESLPDKPETPQIPKRATVAAIGRHYRKQLDWLVKCARNYDDYQDRFNHGNLLDEKEMRQLFANAEIVGAAVWSSNSGNKTGLDVKSGHMPSGAHSSEGQQPTIEKPAVNLWFFGHRRFVEYSASLKDRKGVERSFTIIFDLSEMRDD